MLEAATIDTEAIAGALRLRAAQVDNVVALFRRGSLKDKFSNIASSNDKAPRSHCKWILGSIETSTHAIALNNSAYAQHCNRI